VAALLGSACSGAGGGGGGAAAPVTFGAPVSLDGAYVVEGGYTLHGYQYCKDVVNQKGGITYGGQSHQLKIVTQDDQSVARNAATIVDQLNDQGVKFILSPYSSPLTAAAAPVVEKNRQVMVDSNGADTTVFHQGYRSTFGVLSPSSSYLTSMIDWLAGLSPAPKTVAIVAADDGFSQTAAAAGVKEAQAKGMSVVPSADAPSSSTKVAASTTDVHTALGAIKPFAPDVILVSAHFNEAAAAIKQGVELGVAPKLGFGATVAVPSNAFTSLGATVQGVFGSTQWVPEVTTSDKLFGTAQQFAQGYTGVFGDVVGGVPAYQAAEAAAACEVLVSGIEKANSVDPTQVRSAIAGMSIDTFYGHIQFDGASGTNPGLNSNKPMQVIQVQGEPASPKLVTVFPASAATSGKAIWPAPAG
jgi:branched-chain amino acid transport system substrate-binding protein